MPLAKEPAGDDYVFRGPMLKRMTAEQFIDAVWMITGTAPGEADGRQARRRGSPDGRGAAAASARRW